jgi:hypothetical protein
MRPLRVLDQIPSIVLCAGFEVNRDLAMEYEALGRLEDRDRERSMYERSKQAQLREAAGGR